MNESQLPVLNDTNHKSEKPRSAVALLALVLALVSLGGSGLIWWQSQGTANGEAERISAEMARRGEDVAKLESRLGTLEVQVSSLAKADLTDRLIQAEQDVASLRAAAANWPSFQAETAALTGKMQISIEGSRALLTTAETRLATAETRLTTAETRLAALAARDLNSAAQLDLAEVDYILRLAQERLQLFGDTRTATQALKIAEQQVAAFDRPAFMGVQRELAAALQKLSLVKEPDYLAFYHNIDTLQNDFLTLPFKGETTPAEAPTEVPDTGWWARIRQAFSGLVTVRRSTVDEGELPVLADRELIRQQAWMELEVARLAAMRRDQESYSTALKGLSTRLAHWFDASSSAVQNAQVSLASLQAVDIDPPLPDISAPLVALQAIRNSEVPISPQQAAQKVDEVDNSP